MTTDYIKEWLRDAERALESAFDDPSWQELYDAYDDRASAQEDVARAISAVRDAQERL